MKNPVAEVHDENRAKEMAHFRRFLVKESRQIRKTFQTKTCLTSIVARVLTLRYELAMEW